MHIARAEMVLSIDHRPLIVGLQRAAGKPGLIPRQPQRGVHHMEIIIQQGKAQIVWPDTVGPVLVHPQRCRTGELRFELPIEGREAAVKADHQGELLLCSEFNEPLSVGQVVGQRFIDANMNARLQQLADNLIVSDGGGVDKDHITVAGQIL